MKIAVIGAGAIGCLTGALLWDCGIDVALVGRPGQAEAINSGGVVLDGLLGGRRFHVPVRAALDFRPGMVILAVKTQDVEAACRAVKPWADDALVLTTQNGVRADGIAAAVLGRERIISAVVMFGATGLEPGRVVYNFPGGLIIGRAFPEAGGKGGEEGLEEARTALSAAFDVHVNPDIRAVRWTKLLLNLNNALAGILGLDLQEVFGDPRLCRLGVTLMREAYGVLAGAGINLVDLPDLPAVRLKGLLDAPLEVSSGIYGGIMRGLCGDPLPGSVLQSIRRGRASEVDYLNGEIVSQAENIGLSAPLNGAVARLVKEVEAGGRFMTKNALLDEVKDLMQPPNK